MEWQEAVPIGQWSYIKTDCLKHHKDHVKQTNACSQNILNYNMNSHGHGLLCTMPLKVKVYACKSLNISLQRYVLHVVYILC